MRPFSTRTRCRPRGLLAALLALLACALAVQVAPAAAAGAPSPSSSARERLAFAARIAPLSNRLAPEIIGGQETSIEQVPWQVFVLVAAVEGSTVTELACGGSIISSTQVLTAAHCITHEGTTTKYPAGDIVVVAGTSNVTEAVEELVPPAGSQTIAVSGVRVHPYYSVSPIHDDNAVLTLNEPLNLSGPKAKAISLVPVGQTPAAGTPLSLSGFGKENGAPTSKPNWLLYSTGGLSAVGSDACRELVEPESAVLLCASGPASSGCQGDSGGPLTEGNPAVEVGTVDYGLAGCPVGTSAAFSNLAAPEVRAFIEGSETPPIAPRQTSRAVIRADGPPAVVLSPETCEPGAWSGSPTLTYNFQTEGASPQVLQSGPSNTFVPPASAAGAQIVCVIQASNAGGVATGRTGTLPALQSDKQQPSGAISGVSCRQQSCTVSISAGDPYAVALTVQGTAIYKVNVRCPPKKGQKGKPKGGQPVCSKAVNAVVSAQPVSTTAGVTTYRATLGGLPYGQTVVLRAVVTNAAGLRPTSAPVRAVLLHQPAKPKPHGKKSTGKHRRR